MQSFFDDNVVQKISKKIIVGFCTTVKNIWKVSEFKALLDAQQLFQQLLLQKLQKNQFSPTLVPSFQKEIKSIVFQGPN